jgi:protocatechuate 3,4-dioxygenase beta subunit
VRRLVGLSVIGAAATLAATVGSGAAVAQSCRATLPDSAGPFGQVAPPLRAKIGTGHVLTGVVLSALDCRPIAGAKVQFWQSNRRGRYTPATSGTVVTSPAGRFRFEGPMPSAYEGRSAHIHIRVVAPLHEILLSRYEPSRGARSGRVQLVLQPEEL